MEIKLKDQDKLIDCTAEVIDGVLVVSPKEEAWPKFPTTVDECLEVLGRATLTLDSMNGYKAMGLMTLQALLVCRDAYWKLAGDWRFKIGGDSKEVVYAITMYGDGIMKDFYHELSCNRILVFPTEEMRDTFYENFRKLINDCKEFL